MAWIRSQNRELLLNAEIFEYSGKGDAHRLFASGAKIGTFPTKEAALAELDCIERWLSTGTSDVYLVASYEHYAD